MDDGVVEEQSRCCCFKMARAVSFFATFVHLLMANCERAIKCVAGSDDHDTNLSCHHLWLECSSTGGRLPQIHVLSKRRHPNCFWPLPIPDLVSMGPPLPPINPALFLQRNNGMNKICTTDLQDWLVQICKHCNKWQLCYPQGIFLRPHSD